MSDMAKNFLYLIMIISILRMLSPSKEYDKYIKFFISLLLVISIFSPILTVIKDGKFSKILNDNYIRIDEFETQINEGKINTEELIIENYKLKIENNISSIIEKKYYTKNKVKVSLLKDSNKENYGDITNIDIIINKDDSRKKNKIKNYISKTYLVDIKNINIKTGSVT
ncbi:stage III sporulation protein AF [Anaerofustis sp.]|uniref:stage III sporulation protein AF n=1 Tax=Anaerofustis sp. TaxID=1872517 RepID=UPI0025C00539|nr:stage III sporulation protein AF [Anaerofustis sp.]